MRFFGTEVVKCSVVVTDHGKYRVDIDGTVEPWNSWGCRDTADLDPSDLATIRRQGVSALELTAS